MVVQLDVVLAESGVAVPMAGANLKMSSALLHSDAGGGRSMVVGFPAGFSMPDTGYVTVDEEFLVLRGSITISGTALGAGTWVHIPAGVERHRIDSLTGALVYAWFAGSVRLVRAGSDTPYAPSAGGWTHRVLRSREPLRQATHASGGSEVIGPGELPDHRSYELVDWRAGDWELVSAETSRPGGATLYVRSHPQPAQ